MTVFEELAANTNIQGNINPQFLVGKSIYNSWVGIDGESIYLVLWEGWIKLKITGVLIRKIEQ